MKKAIKKHQFVSILSGVFVVLTLLLVGSMKPAYAQESLSGWFSIIWGDSDYGASSRIYTLTDKSGQLTILQINEDVIKDMGGILKFHREFVEIQGFIIQPPVNFKSTADSVRSPSAAFNVTSMSLVRPPESKAPIVNGVIAAAVSGSNPWVTIMCKFSDISAEPENQTFFHNMYSDTKPGLNHYWKELSFETANIDGSAAGGTGWYDLPNTESHYNPTDTEKGTNLNLLAAECIAAADPDVDFSAYDGINMMFNSNFDNGWAWGGSGTYTLDGETRTWSTTWEPPWAYANISVIAHEMGHGFGLPHSTAPGGGVYDNPWDVMSKDRYNCAAATDPTYGCMAQHTISYHKDLLDWIPGARKTTVSDGNHNTYTLEDLAAPATENYQMIKLPIGGSANNFYTVEARRFTGYDSKIPGQGVVIHKVDTTADEPAVLVLYPGGGSEDPWGIGQTFIDSVNSISVALNEATTTGYEVTVSNGNLPPVSDAGGPYQEECTSPETLFVLNGSASSDPDGDPITYSWSTTCDGSFDDSTAAAPTLSINTSDVCNENCSVSLTVTDENGLSGVTASAIVTVVDTLPPELVNVPNDETVECDAVPGPADVTAQDNCDTDVTPTFDETREDGNCLNNYTLTRTWTATDGCGNSKSASQKITVEDTVGPEIDCDNPDTIIPPETPISFTATATDNCTDNPSVEIVSYECFKLTKKGTRINKMESCSISVSGDTITILDSGGVNDNITWKVLATDECGNSEQKDFSITVVNPGNL